MSRILLLSALAALAALSCFAQEARKERIGEFRYLGRHDSFFYDVYVTSAGNYAATGRTEAGADPEPFWVVLSDRNGREIWSSTFPQDQGGFDEGDATSIIETDDGDFVVGGQMELNGRMTFVVMKCDAEGEQLWWRTYGGNSVGLCLAVIEPKGGGILACGTVGERGSEQAHAVMLEPDGDIVWEQTYDNGVCFNAVREIQDGFLFADYGPDRGLTRVNGRGEFVWQHRVSGYLLGLVSCPVGGGFAACGSLNRMSLLVRFDDQGNEQWSRTYNRIDNNYRGVANCLLQLPDGGFLMVGERPLIWSTYRTTAQIEIRVDADGNLMWHRGAAGILVMGYLSVVRDIDSLTVIAGSVDLRQQPAGSDFVGILDKVFPERSAPRIVNYSPEELQLQVMRLDTVHFSVEAIDYQEDDIEYEWLMDDSVRIGREARQDVVFTELWDHTVTCIVSDSRDETRLNWSVYVIELYISGYQPDSLNLRVPRCTPVDFSVEVVAVEPDSVEFSWVMADSVVGTGAEFSVEFPLPQAYRLTALATANGFTDLVRWDIRTQSTIDRWRPRELELCVAQYDSQEFSLIASHPESDSLAYRWLYRDEVVSVDDSVSIAFTEDGQFDVIGCLTDGSAVDSMVWRVEVLPDKAPEDSDRPPERFKLIAVHPNPFNRLTAIDFYVDRMAPTELTVCSPVGELVALLYSGVPRAGHHSVIWNAAEVPSGYYLIRLSSGSQLACQSAVLLK